MFFSYFLQSVLQIIFEHGNIKSRIDSDGPVLFLKKNEPIIPNLDTTHYTITLGNGVVSREVFVYVQPSNKNVVYLQIQIGQNRHQRKIGKFAKTYLVTGPIAG